MNISPAVSWYTPRFEIQNGAVPVPTRDGLGVDYDPEIWREATVFIVKGNMAADDAVDANAHDAIHGSIAVAH